MGATVAGVVGAVGAGAATVVTGAVTCGIGATVSPGATACSAAATAMFGVGATLLLLVAPTLLPPDGDPAGPPVGSVMVPSGDGNWLIGALVCGATAPSGASAEGVLAIPGFVVGVWSVAVDCVRSAAPNAAVMPRIAVAESPVERMRAERATCR